MVQNALNHKLFEVEPEGPTAFSTLWGPVRSSVLTHGERRLEASTFLTDGYGLRQNIEAVASSAALEDFANVWQPSRLKGYLVPEGRGLPFLSAGQVFESKPRVRKWIAEAMTPAPQTRYVEGHWLLMSCSGEVGRVTAVYGEHLEKIITHDLLRVVPREAGDYGWLYAYMKTPTFYAMARSSQYGHMIKHLEPEHVLRLPVALPDPNTRSTIGRDAQEALEMRRRSRSLQREADRLLGELVNPSGEEITQTPFATVRANALTEGRRRIEGQFHRSDVLHVERLVKYAATRVDRLVDVVKSVGVGSRFKRYFGPNATPYRSASELFDVNAPVTKRIYSALLPNPERYMLSEGWIIMACSGQTYGLLGRTMVLTENHNGVFGSHDLIRIIPDEALARTGYLQTVLNHTEYGRPRVVRYASGTSVPHLDPSDIREVLIPRFDAESENRIANLSDEATMLAAEADRREMAAVAAAERAVANLTGRRGSLSLVGGAEE